MKTKKEWLQFKSNKPKALCDLIPSTNSHCDSSQLDSKVPQVMDVQNDDGQTDFKHKLELRLVKADQEDKHFKEHFEESYAVYKYVLYKYTVCKYAVYKYALYK